MYDDLDHISFAEWLVKLNDVAAKAGYRTNASFVYVTGQIDWYHYYEEGLMPDEALAIAAWEGEQFGKYYIH